MSSIVRIALVFAIVAATPSLFAEATLVITKPAAGTVVNPGQTTVVYVSPSGGPFTSVSIIAPGPNGFGTQPLTSPPYQFSFTAPQITPGLYPITAMGNTATGTIFSEGVYIDIERSDSPQRISTGHSDLELQIGDQIPIGVFGTYSDGSIVDLSKSTRTKYEPTSAGVASVTNDGVITALTAGSTTIVVRHQNREGIVKLIVVPRTKVHARSPPSKLGSEREFDEFSACSVIGM